MSLPRDPRPRAYARVSQRSRRLDQTFFARDPREVAPALLGKLLVRRDSEGVRCGRVVEVEAYLGQHDPAAHAAAGLTQRNAVLFGPPGHAYVYFIYGNHFCLNVSCQPEGEAGCVLFRALAPISGIEQMARARGYDPAGLAERNTRLLTSGPGRLTQAMSITRERDNSKDMTSEQSDLVLVDDGNRPEEIAATPRIGITKASHELLRFIIKGNPFVSGKPLDARKRQVAPVLARG